MVDPDLHLLPEYRGADVYWLYHDNYLAAKVLAETNPKLSRSIRTAIKSYGVAQSGKIEILFGESPQGLPYKQYELTDVRRIGKKLIRTEVVKKDLLLGWEKYADLLFFAAMAEKDPHKARAHFEAGMKMWSGLGFEDAVVKHHKQYATYKLALSLIAAKKLAISHPHKQPVVERLLALQGPVGGWITDYDLQAKPVGLANVETTSLAILALQTCL
ncbi:MAG: hypothetical protein U0903_09460 [Planctomycetales bacterium]